MEGFSRSFGYIDKNLYDLIKYSQAVAQLINIPEKQENILDNIGILGKLCRNSNKEVTEEVEKALAQTKNRSPIFKEVLKDIQLIELLKEDKKRDRTPEKGSLSERQHPPKDVPDSEEIFLSLFTQISSLILQGNVSLDQLYLLAIEALQRGVGLDRVLLCLLKRDRKELDMV